MSDYLKRSLFWLVVALVLVVLIICTLLFPVLGVVLFFVSMLAMALIILLKPAFWRTVNPFRKKDKQAVSKQPASMTKMVLERCDTNSASLILIDKPDFVLGRSPDCDYVFSGMGTISGHHCRITYNPQTKNFYLEDLKSRNGTFVNSGRLEPNNRVLLKPHSMVSLDRYQYIFKPYRP